MNSFGSAPMGAKGPAGRPVRAARDVRALRLALCLVAVCLLPALAFLGSCSSNSSGPDFSNPPVPPTQDWLFDVTGTAANDVYACGAKGAMFRFDGTSWTAVPMGMSDPIVRMWKEDAGSTLYAVGHKGRIWHNTGGSWASMTSGTSQNLYGIGSLEGIVHAVGQDGTICRLSGSTWSQISGSMFLLNENNVPVDTLQVADDLESLVTVNNYFLGGAYIDPDFTGTRVGVYGTRGMVLAPNSDPLFSGEWILRPISGEQIIPHEWVLCTTSDPAVLSRNLLGTSEGWLFKLTRDDNGKNVWQKFYPSLTVDPGSGVTDLWLDETGNAYIVTDEGQIVFQTVDYDYSAGTGRRAVLYDNVERLTAIWGTGPDNLWFVGYRVGTIMHGVHNQSNDQFTYTATSVTFPDKGAPTAMTTDHLGRPLN